ncbi:MAG: peptidoglycan DD-metalloendopeptidase family protein [Azoarcus sp.]|jgi:septal ring factor EnvC (AmiA/AmiB activator)|nr:peptidoglycan DD-metalloendopeptidase family protein [Azoarcus sp.]
MRLRAACLLVLALGYGLAPPAAQAQNDAEISEKRSDLDDLKRRIRELQRDLDKGEAERSSAAKAVIEAQRELSKAARALQRLVAERRDAERKLTILEAEQREIETRIRSRRDELASWLRRHYMHGAADGVAPFLSALDPNQIARDAFYLEALGRARLALIDGLRADLHLRTTRAAEIDARREELARLEENQRARQQQLAELHAQRREALANISAQLSSRHAEVDALKADEASLARLIDMLAQRARETAARQARLEAERAAQNAATTQNAAVTRLSPDGRHIGEPVVGEIRHAVPAVNFAKLRGQLRFPVTGELSSRFGAQRVGGGTTWKGVFIRAANGAEVRAVGQGEVVFSDWLRGYGNLLIIDHGGEYLSVYGNNDVLYKEVGDTVYAGDTIASVGESGVGPESGLYFEIRHQGQAIDPMQWVRRE